MKSTRKNSPHPRSISRMVREWIETGGERVWRLSDFSEYPFQAVAQALSRLTRQGALIRLGKGLYYRSRKTPFGPSLPSPTAIRDLSLRPRGVYPAGLAASSLLGFTTQHPARVELATDRQSLPRMIVGKDTLIHTRRPPAWRHLSKADAALLDFLRLRGQTSDLPADETAKKLLLHFSERGRFERLERIAASEPPRVRAMMGAIGQALGKPRKELARLRESLNPFSRFEFGILRALTHAAEWQAKRH